jgi:hypothetical protein
MPSGVAVSTMLALIPAGCGGIDLSTISLCRRIAAASTHLVTALTELRYPAVRCRLTVIRDFN